LIIVGEGELRKECQNWVKENKLKEVYFEGGKTSRTLPFYYTRADIFVSPAIFGESFGIVLLEAMASGTPFIAFANKGYKEFLKGKRGEEFLVKPKDYRALAKKIEILIRNPRLRKELGHWGIKEAKKYSWSKIADQVLEFYELSKKERINQARKKRFATWPKYKELFKKLRKEIGF